MLTSLPTAAESTRVSTNHGYAKPPDVYIDGVALDANDNEDGELADYPRLRALFLQALALVLFREADALAPTLLGRRLG